MKNLLILEDEPFIAMDLQYAVEDAGHRPLAAIDNEEAAREIENNRIDGAILDVNLGRETCQATAMRLREACVPFILHTGDLNRAGEELQALDAPVVAKPQIAEDVVEKLLALMKEKQDDC